MDDFEVIYTQEDIKAADRKYEELNSQFLQLTKEKRQTDVILESLREKVKSFEKLNQEVEAAKASLYRQKAIYDELNKQHEIALNAKNEQDVKLIKVMKEKHEIQQELESMKQDNEEMTGWMMKEMDSVRSQMTSTFVEQSRIQATTTRTEIQQLQQSSQQRLLEKQQEYEELNDQLVEKSEECEKIKLELTNCRNQVAQSQRQVALLTEQLKEVKKYVEEMKSELESLKKQIKKDEEVKGNLEVQVASLKSINNEIINEIQLKSKQSEKWLKEIDSLKLDLKRIEGVSSNLENENKLKSQEIAKLASALQSLKSQESRVSESVNKVKALEEELEFKKVQLSSAESSIAEREKDLNSVLEMNQEMSDKHSALKNALESLQSELFLIKEKVVSTEQELSAKVRSEAESQRLLTEKTVEHAKIQECLGVAKKECSNILNSLENSEKKVKLLTEEIKSLDKVIQHLKEESGSGNSKNQSLSEQVRIMAQELERLNKTIEQNGKELFEMSESNRQLKSDLQKSLFAQQSSREVQAALQQEANVLVNRLEMEQGKFSELQASYRAELNVLQLSSNESNAKLQEAREVSEKQSNLIRGMEMQYQMLENERDVLQQCISSQETKIGELSQKLDCLDEQLSVSEELNSNYKSEIESAKVKDAQKMKALFSHLFEVFGCNWENEFASLGCLVSSEVSLEAMKELISKVSQKAIGLKEELYERNAAYLVLESENQIIQKNAVRCAESSASESQWKEQQEAMLIKQKQEFKDLKYDLETKVNTLQASNEALQLQKTELLANQDILLKENKSLQMMVQALKEDHNSFVESYAQKVNQSEETISSLQQLLENQDVDDLIQKRINDTLALAIETKEKQEIAEFFIEQAEASVKKAKEILHNSIQNLQ